MAANLGTGAPAIKPDGATRQSIEAMHNSPGIRDSAIEKHQLSRYLVCHAEFNTIFCDLRPAGVGKVIS